MLSGLDKSAWYNTAPGVPEITGVVPGVPEVTGVEPEVMGVGDACILWERVNKAILPPVALAAAVITNPARTTRREMLRWSLLVT